MPARRPDPVRTCVACRQSGAKRDLVRVVRRPGGGLEVDRRGKAPGRGAYVHADPSCWEVALKRGALARALRTGLSPQEAGTLLVQLREATTQ